MRVTFPHMGYIHIGIRAMADHLGAELVVPPPTSHRSLSLGVKYSPEMACLPFKLALGNMIEALELGADAIIMPGGSYGCRFGYYHKVQEAILQELGYDFEMVTQDLGMMHMVKHVTKGNPLRKVITGFRFGLAKLKALDKLEQLVYKIRPVARDKGEASRIHREGTRAIDNAADYQALNRARQEHLQELINLPTESIPAPLKIGLTGEFYVLIDDFANMDIKAELGRLGVEVCCPLSVGEWVRFNPLAIVLGLREKDRSHKAAKPYLSGTVFGDGWQSVGEKVLHARDWDGLIHLEPFGCLPEIVARNIVPSTKESLPVLDIICDEHTAKVGVVNRLEAFTDMIQRKKRRRV